MITNRSIENLLNLENAKIQVFIELAATGNRHFLLNKTSGPLLNKHSTELEPQSRRYIT